MGMRKINYVIGILMLFLAGYVFMTSSTYPSGDKTLGPAFFPDLAAGGLVFFSISLMVQTALEQGTSERIEGPGVIFWMANGALVAYLLIMPILGFLTTTPVFLYGVGMYMAYKSGEGKFWCKKLIASSVITTGALYYLFATLLNVPLP